MLTAITTVSILPFCAGTVLSALLLSAHLLVLTRYQVGTTINLILSFQAGRCLKHFQVLGLSADCCPVLCPQPPACESSVLQVPPGWWGWPNSIRPILTLWHFLLQLWTWWPGYGDCTRTSPTWITRSAGPGDTTMIPKATVNRPLSGWIQTRAGSGRRIFTWVISFGDLSWTQKIGALSTSSNTMALIPFLYFPSLNLHNSINSDFSSIIWDAQSSTRLPPNLYTSFSWLSAKTSKILLTMSSGRLNQAFDPRFLLSLSGHPEAPQIHTEPPVYQLSPYVPFRNSTRPRGWFSLVSSAGTLPTPSAAFQKPTVLSWQLLSSPFVHVVSLYIKTNVCLQLIFLCLRKNLT